MSKKNNVILANKNNKFILQQHNARPHKTNLVGVISDKSVNLQFCMVQITTAFFIKYVSFINFYSLC
jgi:hypothetical protein